MKWLAMMFGINPKFFFSTVKLDSFLREKVVKSFAVSFVAVLFFFIKKNP